MASHDIEITRSAERQLKRLPPGDQQRVVAILPLSDNPFPRVSRKLSGYDDVLRIRVGTYRVLYSVSEKKLIIIILKIGHRKNAYR